MAGTPIEKKMWAEIAELGGPDGILERISNGDTLGKISETMSVSRSFLSWKLNAIPGMKERLVAARRGRAEKYAEDAVDIADNVKADPNEINKAKVKIDARKWLAGVDDPDRFGAKKDGVTINIGTLHLDALRRVQSDLSAASATIAGEAVDVTPEE